MIRFLENKVSEKRMKTTAFGRPVTDEYLVEVNDIESHIRKLQDELVRLNKELDDALPESDTYFTPVQSYRDVKADSNDITKILNLPPII